MLETGVAVVDRDHRTLVDMINRLDALISAEPVGLDAIGALIDDLTQYAEEHFRREEDMLARLGWPGLAQHADGHTRFALGLGAMIAACMIEPGPAPLGRLRDHLQSWLADHILTEDMAFAGFVRDRLGIGG